MSTSRVISRSEALAQSCPPKRLYLLLQVQLWLGWGAIKVQCCPSQAGTSAGSSRLSYSSALGMIVGLVASKATLSTFWIMTCRVIGKCWAAKDWLLTSSQSPDQKGTLSLPTAMLTILDVNARAHLHDHEERKYLVKEQRAGVLRQFLCWWSSSS